MMNTFDALASFPNENDEAENGNPNSTASVDLSAIINRLNELETRVNTIMAHDFEPSGEQQNDGQAGKNLPSNNESEGNSNGSEAG